MSESDGSEDGGARVTRSQWISRVAAAVEAPQARHQPRGQRRFGDDGPHGLLSDDDSDVDHMDEDGDGGGGAEDGYEWEEGDDEDGEDSEDAPLPGVAPALTDMLNRLRGHPMFDFLAQLGGAALPAVAAAAGAEAAGAAHGPEAPPPVFPFMTGPGGEAAMGMGSLALLGALGVPMPGGMGGGPGGAPTEAQEELFFRTLMSMHPGASHGFAAAAGVAGGGAIARRTPEQVVAAQDAWLEAQAAEQARIAADVEQLLAVPESAPVFVDVCGVAAVQQRARSAAVRNALKDQQFVAALLQKMAERVGHVGGTLHGPLLQKTAAMMAG